MFEEFPEYFEAEWIFTEKNSISKKFIPRKILRGGGIKKKYHRHNGVSVGWVTSFVGEYFFFLGWVFFLAFGQKKISAKKKKISPTNEVIIQRKHHYPYNIPFFMPKQLKIGMFWKFKSWYFFLKCDIFFL